MKIAVASQTKKVESKISEQAGRSPFYLIFDEQGSLLTAVKNPFSRGGGGAGFGVAKMLADKEVDLVVAGEFGPKMIAALEERGLRALEAAGTVREGLTAAGV
jgi:predicted Fe-Mo cluster-binding NifX family protein